MPELRNCADRRQLQGTVLRRWNAGTYTAHLYRCRCGTSRHIRREVAA
jgi:hypothetical protein